MKQYKKQCNLSDAGTAIGVGLIAGLAGTLVMTWCQKMEMKRTGRKGSDIPSKAVTEVFNIKPVTESKSMEMSKKVHWVYGTSLGLIRGAMGLFGLRGFAASAIHFFIIWGGKSLMLPALKVAAPITKEKPKTILKDAYFHLVYAFATGCVFDAIYQKNKYPLSKEQRMAIKKIISADRDKRKNQT